MIHQCLSGLPIAKQIMSWADGLEQQNPLTYGFGLNAFDRNESPIT